MAVLNLNITGIKFAPGAADIIEALPGGAELTLTPEPENRFDKNAIRVEYDGAKLGYVPAALCKNVRPLMDEQRIDMIMTTSGNKFEVHYDGGLEND